MTFDPLRFYDRPRKIKEPKVFGTPESREKKKRMREILDDKLYGDKDPLGANYVKHIRTS